jgi:DNA-binding NarL/FixJ family response regulator
MDVQMPGMDGRQSTEAIRQWESERHCTPLPIVALTAHAMANEKRALLQSGMDDYLTKPISERQLAQVVLKWTGLACATSAERASDSHGQQRTARARPRRRLAPGRRQGRPGGGHAGDAAGLAGSRPRSDSRRQ